MRTGLSGNYESNLCATSWNTLAPSLFRILISTLFLLQRVSQTDAAVEKTASDEVITAAEDSEDDELSDDVKNSLTF